MTEIDDVKRIGRSPAFPLAMSANNKPHDGMTLRQWYAGLAMQGLLAATAGDPAKEYTPEGCASAARRYADALLLEISK
jgi:hypothetical protein